MRSMNAAEIAKDCKRKGGYSTPSLNEQLYLHFAGYSKIENLEPFKACGVLWLEHNSIETIENLETLRKLRVLHMDHNRLRGLGNCRLPSVESLNVSHNFIDDLSGLVNFPNLKRLFLANNNIDDTQLVHLAHVPNLTALDLGKNRLANPERLLEVLAKLPKLMTLTLTGNEVVRELKNYRRRLICHVPQLCHLDETPVFVNERRTAEAWARGGREAEKAEHDAIRAEDEERRLAQRAFFEQFLADARQQPPTAGRETEYARTMRMHDEAELAREASRHRCKSALTPEPAKDDDDDDDDIAIASAAPAPATRRAPVGRPSGTVKAESRRGAPMHDDPFASLSAAAAEPSNESSTVAGTGVGKGATGAAPPRSEGERMTEDDVLRRIGLDGDFAAKLRAVLVPEQPASPPRARRDEAEEDETCASSAGKEGSELDGSPEHGATTADTSAAATPRPAHVE